MKNSIWIALLLIGALFGRTSAACPDGVAQVACFAEPCSLRPPQNCTLPERYSCVSDYCGGCNRHYYDANGMELCTGNQNLCPEGAPMVQCLVDPCSLPAPADCDTSNKEIVCKSNYCGECARRYYDAQGNEVCKGSSSNVCSDGSTPVQCIADPCSLPAPSNCDTTGLTCVADYCGGCNRRYYDAKGQLTCNECSKDECGPQPLSPNTLCHDNKTVEGYTGRCIRSEKSGTCAWEYRSCPIETVCPFGWAPNPDGVTLGPSGYPMCALYCEYGYEQDKNGCALCQCKKAMDCSVVDCAPTASCKPDEELTIKPGGCCPECTPKCEDVACPMMMLACPKNVSQLTLPKATDDFCCPRCDPIVECPAEVLSACPIVCPMGWTLVKHPGSCCPTCELEINCIAVLCAAVECAAGYKKVVKEGQCCPSCERLNTCDRVVCSEIACPAGMAPVKRDLECCPSCVPANTTDRCMTVRCARPSCDPSVWIKREGMCCPQCPQCYSDADPSSTERCTLNDDTVCSPGYFRLNKEGRCVPILEEDRTELRVPLEIPPTSSLYNLTPNQILIAIALKAGVKVENLYLIPLPTESSSDSHYYILVIAEDSGKPSGEVVDVGRVLAALETASSQSLSSDAIFLMDDSNSNSSLALVPLCAIFLALYALIFLLSF